MILKLVKDWSTFLCNFLRNLQRNTLLGNISLFPKRILKNFVINNLHIFIWTFLGSSEKWRNFQLDFLPLHFFRIFRSNFVTLIAEENRWRDETDERAGRHNKKQLDVIDTIWIYYWIEIYMPITLYYLNQILHSPFCSKWPLTPKVSGRNWICTCSLILAIWWDWHSVKRGRNSDMINDPSFRRVNVR